MVETLLYLNALYLNRLLYFYLIYFVSIPLKWVPPCYIYQLLNSFWDRSQCVVYPSPDLFHSLIICSISFLSSSYIISLGFTIISVFRRKESMERIKTIIPNELGRTEEEERRFLSGMYRVEVEKLLSL